MDGAYVIRFHSTPIMENRLSMELLEHGVLNTIGNCQSKELVSTSAVLMQIVDVLLYILRNLYFQTQLSEM